MTIWRIFTQAPVGKAADAPRYDKSPSDTKKFLKDWLRQPHPGRHDLNGPKEVMTQPSAPSLWVAQFM
uniref:Uncharacterized protein n=1 Tax=mine drainage metagenome TaxID=410659 RepID=E6PN06_9ZZZZ